MLFQLSNTITSKSMPMETIASTCKCDANVMNYILVRIDRTFFSSIYSNFDCLTIIYQCNLPTMDEYIATLVISLVSVLICVQSKYYIFMI